MEESLLPGQLLPLGEGQEALLALEAWPLLLPIPILVNLLFFL